MEGWGSPTPNATFQLGTPLCQHFTQHRTMAMRFILAVAADREVALAGQYRK